MAVDSSQLLGFSAKLIDGVSYWAKYLHPLTLRILQRLETLPEPQFCSLSFFSFLSSLIYQLSLDKSGALNPYLKLYSRAMDLCHLLTYLCTWP